MRRRFQVGTESFDLDIVQTGAEAFRVSRVDGGVESSLAVDVLRSSADAVVVSIDHGVFEIRLLRRSTDSWEISHAGHAHFVSSDAWTGRKINDSRAPPKTTVLVAPMPGRIVEVRAGLGATLEQGAPVVVIEAMKMQNELFAETAGKVTQVWVKVGDIVETGSALVEISR